MVTEPEKWVEPLADWLRKLVEGSVPILGVCYGHQLLAHALGGRVGFHPEGPEIGTKEVDLRQEGVRDPLLEGMPKRFYAHTTHAQTVLTLPHGSVLLARTEHEAHAAFRFGACAWGVQFHPEYDDDIMRHYIRAQRKTLQALGQDPDKVDRGVRPVETGRILRRFAALSDGGGATLTESG
jgi:GMP synthase (glutamine-hydrolysing)